MASPPPTAEKGRVQQHDDGVEQVTQVAPSPLDSPSASTSHTPLPAHGNRSFHSAGPSSPAPTAAQGYDDSFDLSRAHRGATPPPYSGPSGVLPSEAEVEREDRSPTSRRPPQRYPGLPRIDYSLYSPATFELLPGAVGIKSTATYLSANEQALLDLVRSQATVPPKPVIEIRGTRGRRVDFDVRCNLMSLIVPEDPRGRLDYIRCTSPGEAGMRGGSKPRKTPQPGDGSLEAWVRAYLEDQSHTKCFVLERAVVNLDANWLEGQIRTTVAAMGYTGLVTVNFLTLHSRVVVQSPDRINKLFTSISALFAGRSTYEVVKAIWPFATHRNGEPGRRCVVQSEETWWREWRDPIRFAIASKTSGWVTNEDKLEAIMEGKGKGMSAVDWGPESDGA